MNWQDDPASQGDVKGRFRHRGKENPSGGLLVRPGRVFGWRRPGLRHLRGRAASEARQAVRPRGVRRASRREGPAGRPELRHEAGSSGSG